MSRRTLDTGGYIHDEPSKTDQSPPANTRPSAGDGAATTPRRSSREEQPQGASAPPAPRRAQTVSGGDNIYERQTELKSSSTGQGVPVKGRPQAAGRRHLGGTGAATGIYRPGMPASPPAAETPAALGGLAQPTVMDDPPVGWLVVVSGHGQGNVLTLGNGINSLGREASERLQLDFGDPMVSRKNHTTVTYDPRGRKFYIQHGNGTNLTYINNEPVLTLQELQPHTQITVGDTVLRFVPLCGQQFNWGSEAADDAS